MQTRTITHNPSGLSRLAAAFGVLGLAGGATAFGLGCKRVMTIEGHHSVYGLPQVRHNLGDIVVLEMNEGEGTPDPAESQVAACSSPLFKTFMLQIPYPVRHYIIDSYDRPTLYKYQRLSMQSTLKPFIKFLEPHRIPESYLTTTQVTFDLAVLRKFSAKVGKMRPGMKIAKKTLEAAISSLRGVVALQACSDVKKPNDMGTNLKDMSQAGTNGLPQNLIAAFFRTPYFALVLDPANLSDENFSIGTTLISEVEDLGKLPRDGLDDLMNRLLTIPLPPCMMGLENARKFIAELTHGGTAEFLVCQEESISVIREIMAIIKSVLDSNKYLKERHDKVDPSLVSEESKIGFTFLLADPRLEKPIKELAKLRETVINHSGSTASEDTSVPSAVECKERLELDAETIHDFLGKITGLMVSEATEPELMVSEATEPEHMVSQPTEPEPTESEQMDVETN